MKRSLQETRSGRRPVIGAIVLVLALSSLAAAPAASAAEVFHFTDQFVTAGFRSTDATGCVTTTVFVVAGRDVDHEPPGAPTRTSGASLRITQLDRCAGTFITCSGSASGVEFVTNPAVREATLTGTIPLQCSTPTGITVTDAFVDLTFAGTGEAERDVNNVHFDFGDLIVNAQFRGATREAVATGTVLVDGTNLTPNPSLRAEIGSETGHEVRVEIP